MTEHHGEHDEAPEGTAVADVEDASRSADPLQRLRADLEAVLELPLAERAEVFGRAHRVVTNELHALELS